MDGWDGKWCGVYVTMGLYVRMWTHKCTLLLVNEEDFHKPFLKTLYVIVEGVRVQWMAIHEI